MCSSIDPAASRGEFVRLAVIGGVTPETAPSAAEAGFPN
jgi:hypothetical protein